MLLPTRTATMTAAATGQSRGDRPWGSWWCLSLCKPQVGAPALPCSAYLALPCSPDFVHDPSRGLQEYSHSLWSQRTYLMHAATPTITHMPPRPRSTCTLHIHIYIGPSSSWPTSVHCRGDASLCAHSLTNRSTEPNPMGSYVLEPARPTFSRICNAV